MVEIFGPGFTGTRLARLLLGRQVLSRRQAGQSRVYAAARDVSRVRDLARDGLILSELALHGRPRLSPALPSKQTVVLLIPPLPEPANSALHDQGLQVQEATCHPDGTGTFLCEVTFVLKGDPERPYFDFITLARAGHDWELKSGLCKR